MLYHFLQVYNGNSTQYMDNKKYILHKLNEHGFIEMLIKATEILK